MTGIKEQLAEYSKEAAALSQKARNHPSTFTQKDADRTDVVIAEHARLKTMVDRNDSLSKALAGVANGPLYDMDGNIEPRDSRKLGAMGALAHAQSGKTKAFTDGITKAFTDAAPMIGGPAVAKALISSGSITAGFTGQIIAEPKPLHHVLSAIPLVEVYTAKGTYLQQSARTNNASTVARSALKPTSVWNLVPKDWEIATVAHLTEPIPRQYLEDYAGLTDFVSAELAHGLSSAVAGFALNGGMAESGSTVQGILNTAGVTGTSYVTSPARTIRRAITELETAGVAPSHIVISPEDWEELESTLAQGGWAMGGTPLDRAASKLWSVPVIVDATMPSGSALVGDLNTVNLLHRSTMRLDWSEASANLGTEVTPAMRDLFRHNELVFRGEVRIGIMIASPPSLRIADLTAA